MASSKSVVAQLADESQGTRSKEQPVGSQSTAQSGSSFTLVGAQDEGHGSACNRQNVEAKRSTAGVVSRWCGSGLSTQLVELS